ncbi:hypothetical protein [Streptomyces montanus]|uniref:hypothetical protein n=1 Tax=Streptomyces montanus TaxID=2580423 RepID=UPI001FE723EC|nr:hypothetical protein [Streptomyces montanus]
MAQAAPARRELPRAPRPSTGRPHVSPLRLAAPVLGGVVYGLWACAIGRDSGPITGWNVLLGVVSGIAFIAVYLGLRVIGPRLRREPRACAWAAFAGISLGFLYSLTGESVLKSSVIACVVAAAVFGAVFYRLYTTED